LTSKKDRVTLHEKRVFASSSLTEGGLRSEIRKEEKKRRTALFASGGKEERKIEMNYISRNEGG